MVKTELTTETRGREVCESQAFMHIAQFWATSMNMIKLQALNKRFYTSKTFLTVWIRTVYRIPKIRLSNHLITQNNKELVFPDQYQRDLYISRGD